jgi:hypothetical protein
MMEKKTRKLCYERDNTLKRKEKTRKKEMGFKKMIIQTREHNEKNYKKYSRAL